MVPMAPSATMARRASCSRNSSARVVEAVGIGRYSDLLFSGAAGPDTVILAHVGREGRNRLGRFPEHLKQSDLKGVRLIISDACIGLPRAPPSSFPTPPGRGG